MLLFCCFALLLFIAAGRTVYLGVLRGASLREAARNEQDSYEYVPAARGTVTDRNGAALAISEPADNITADPHLITEPYSTASKLAPLLGESKNAVAAKLSEHTGFVYLAHGLEAGRAKELLDLGLPGVEGVTVMRRRYPRGTLAAQVLGALGSEGEGLSGIEYSRNYLLAGRAGTRRVVRDGLGQPISITTVDREHAGASLRLTLDANIQQRTEDVLSADASVFHPKQETAIVMDPASGAVLAMADWPQVNLEDKAALTPEDLQNSAVSLDYEPGSTFKVVAMAGALQDDSITPESAFEVPESIEIGGHVIHDAESHPTETLTASQILARSSNVGEIKIASRLGAENFHRWTGTFGFGARTGIELPGEESGVIPAPSRYSGSSMGNLPFGQGEMVTPIQLISAYGVIADGGVLRAPHIVAAVDGRTLPIPAGHRIISSATAAELREMLRGPLQPGGTAAEVTVPGYELAGKTGTAEKIDPQTGRYSTSAFIASFIGFAPVTHPKLLALVVVDEPQSGSIYGGQVAGPAWGELMSFALPYLGIAPE
jgi:cell division protein FtsI (penicillin-binding protein 3)/stage V sporulation protein D (sporulation-specific penicillin-binding protein)